MNRLGNYFFQNVARSLSLSSPNSLVDDDVVDDRFSWVAERGYRVVGTAREEWISRCGGIRERGTSQSSSIDALVTLRND